MIRLQKTVIFFGSHTHHYSSLMITDQQCRKDAKDVFEMCNEVLISDLRRE